ncbi:MAG: DUF4381 domain-containing protein [Betaproteobacteria bacterium]|nr:DUF4381 domain-containing protein [Betaproteobacteria bacterium]MDH5222095.1 DUF4381 domain-containing protein [Betaproteobacteria bacterium]MDH5352039.1 DUF4381 domain-containing protein [Betaproteobacteria bacterium]
MIPDAELAARLRDLHPPPEPSWWPPAPGWWLLALVVVVLAVLAWRRAAPWWRRLRLRRRLLALLEGAGSAAEISQLLRAAALARFPQADAAGLHGAGWVAFLEARDRAPGRFAALGDALTAAPYRPPGTAENLAPLRAAARAWLKAVL